jgi:branched-subunit amino acid transport protein AzlD
MSPAMHVVLAVVAVGVGSLLFRLGPLLGARLLSDRMSGLAGIAGLAVLAALTVRAVVLHEDPALPFAPVHAFVAVGAGLAVAFAGRSVLASVGTCTATYLVLSTITNAL